ncbi:MAG: hypothetical protein JSS27_01120 [Planctomycetes bacterium]|nr:hypothetical protein [Planctomycetota bacterium]
MTSAVTAAASWFGSNRTLASYVGRLVDGCEWVGIPFAGGMAEIAKINARTINVNDLHRHVINLASVIADPLLGPKLYRRLRRLAHHPDTLLDSQERCELIERGEASPDDEAGRLAWAVDYFVCSWMARHASAGTRGEFKQSLSVRWEAGGGDSAAHFQGAIRASANELRRALRRCNFTTLDFRDFLAKCLDKDQPGHAIYCDPPFDGPGNKYKYKFSEQDHRDLRDLLDKFQQARIVVRYYRTAFIESLYPLADWDWLPLVGKKQTNAEAKEVLITRRASL